MRDPHDHGQRARRDAEDPERALVTVLRAAERALPGSLSPLGLARIADWERAQLAAKEAERLASVATSTEVSGG
jgi:hypothetical protein